MDLVFGSAGEMALAQRPTVAAGEPFEASLESAFSEYYPRIVKVLERMLGDSFEAEEVATETFLKLAAQRLPLSEYKNLGGWLYRTATRLGIDFVRAAERRRHYERTAAGELQTFDTPLEQVLRNDRVRAVRAALARLSPFQSQILVLRSHGLAYKELADALNIKATSVGALLARAQAAFEKAYRLAETGREK